ncbi:hypothetical protein FGG08_006903 [Glutinoglossum americanum]|uniref:Uncharacterized protein n=1 Tax=Glutinoglossum americanum TaxID=1670608 RepID=A0A9P8L1F8_9PEZI|nr:hypothetical protein FGG08_006903 [Glutinoglossum americanum]
MSDFTYQPPDLASVLKTLASLAPPQPPQATQPPPAPFVAHTGLSIPQRQDYELEEGEYEPPDSVSQASTVPPPANVLGCNPALQAQPSRDPRLQPASTMPRPPPAETVNRPPPIDATTITDWSAGLKWEGRKALLKKQEARVEGKKKLDEVLRFVGGIVPAGDAVSTPEQDAQELRTFEVKVYKASVEMAKAMSSDLKSLGVPFFGTKPNLVRRKGPGPVNGVPVGGGGGPGGEDGRIDDQELVKLQRKMLELLEDMCK